MQPPSITKPRCRTLQRTSEWQWTASSLWNCGRTDRGSAKSSSCSSNSRPQTSSGVCGKGNSQVRSCCRPLLCYQTCLDGCSTSKKIVDMEWLNSSLPSLSSYASDSSLLLSAVLSLGSAVASSMSVSSWCSSQTLCFFWYLHRALYL